MKKIFSFLIASSIAVMSFSISVAPVGAVELLENLNKAANASFETTKNDPIEIVSTVINTLLAFLGIGATALVIYGGFIWLTARGNEEEVKKGQTIIRNAIIGLIIIMSAYALANFIITNLSTATGVK